MYYCHCSPSRLPLSNDPSTRQHARREIQTILEEWYANTIILRHQAENHHLSLLLKVCYQYVGALNQVEWTALICFHSFYVINLQQRLQRLCQKPFVDPEGSKIILEAATKVSCLVEDSLLYWTPEHFPMI